MKKNFKKYKYLFIMLWGDTIQIFFGLDSLLFFFFFWLKDSLLLTYIYKFLAYCVDLYSLITPL